MIYEVWLWKEPVLGNPDIRIETYAGSAMDAVFSVMRQCGVSSATVVLVYDHQGNLVGELSHVALPLVSSPFPACVVAYDYEV